MKNFTIIIFCMLLVLFQSCEQYLNMKPRSNMVVPSTLDDFEQLLNYSTVSATYPELLELQADDFYLDTDYWIGMHDQFIKNTYIWAKDVYGTVESNKAWDQQYVKVFYANAVLDGLTNLVRTEKDGLRYDQIKGEALFLKAEGVYTLAQLFAPAYNKETATADLGIPIPMKADVNEKMERPTNQYTFDFVINSLLEAERLLKSTADFSRASRPAANALLARVYLYMGDYELAGKYADYSLSYFNSLVNLNLESIRDYKHTILFRYLFPAYEIKGEWTTTLMDSTLIKSYQTGDLRLKKFYIEKLPKRWNKRSFYNISNYCFSGLDADEQYLIRAECYARVGDTDKALSDLNFLLQHRFEPAGFVPYASTDKEKVLQRILEERRKELVFRGLRWSDLKRLNRDGYNISLQRNLAGQIYTLPAGDRRWVFPIPPNEIKITGIQQNER